MNYDFKIKLRNWNPIFRPVAFLSEFVFDFPILLLKVTGTSTIRRSFSIAFIVRCNRNAIPPKTFPVEESNRSDFRSKFYAAINENNKK